MLNFNRIVFFWL